MASSPHLVPAQHDPRGLLLWPSCCLLLLGLRPLDHPDLWWTLARGRASMAGPFSVEGLLHLPGAAASFWADGLPWILIWNAGGLLLLQWTPIVSGMLIFRRLGLFSVHLPPLHGVLLPGLLMILLRPALQPCPLLNTVTCLLLLDAVVQTRSSLLRRCIAVGSVVLLWANIAPLPSWGLCWLLTHPPQSPVLQPRAAPGQFSRSRLSVFAVAFVALCLNPQGPLVILTDMRQLTATSWPFCPDWLAAADSDGPAIASLSVGTHHAPFLLTFSCFAVISGLLQHDRLRRLLLILLPLTLLAFINLELLPLCAVSVLLSAGPLSVKSPAARPNLGWNLPELPVLPRTAITALLSFCMLTDAAGIGPLSASRIGWGLCHTLDSRLLDLPTASASHRPVIWAADRRSAGLAAWRSDAVLLLDHPLTAFQQGRQTEHLRVLDDLQNSRRAAYRLPDGTTGGWYRKLQQWQVTMLITPVECGTLNAALQRSTWKLADLDSPNLPWLTSESESASALIQDLAAQQNFVQWGAWNPDAGVYDSAGIRVDLPELAGFGMDPRPAFRQAALFRSQRLPLAAIRALGPVRTPQSLLFPRVRHLRAAVYQCQRDLAEMEWDNFGIPGLWRRALLEQLSAAVHDRCPPFPWDADLAAVDGLANNQISEFATIAAACAAGQLQEALQLASSGKPETLADRRYATAMILLEIGKVSQAREELNQLLNECSFTPANARNSALQTASRGWLALIAESAGQQP
ncbi:MAG: hypothetical protein ACKO2L_18990 [Planctomycetaceae bacterium]